MQRKLASAPRQLEKATKLALARTGDAIREAEKEEIARVFDRPTRWTLGAMQVKTSTDKLTVTVGIVDPDGFYKRAAKYLDTQVTGGARRQKAFESALIRNGIMPSGWLAVPGEGVTLDAYGNMSAGQIKQILSWFDAAERGAGSTQNMGFAGRDKRRKGSKKKVGLEYVLVPPGRQRNLKQPGIYKRNIYMGKGGKHISPILIFIKKANYKKRFDFERVARATYDQVAQAEFAAAIQRELLK